LFFFAWQPPVQRSPQKTELTLFQILRQAR
jgi:hypothetical protein